MIYIAETSSDFYGWRIHFTHLSNNQFSFTIEVLFNGGTVIYEKLIEDVNAIDFELHR